MGTPDGYSHRVAKPKWSPTPDEAGRALAARMQASRERYAEIETIMTEVKAEVVEFAALGIPVITLAELYDVQRKTIYRWLGMPMS